MPKISIITTTYKHQDFIKNTIESVLSQTYQDWELLIGDDSPDDKTWNIIQKYVKKYPDKIKAWHHNPNKGIVDNMNFLLEKVSEDSKYITFLEGDDMFTPNNLEEKNKNFGKYENKDICAIISNHSEINSSGKKIGNSIIYKIVGLFSLKKNLKPGLNILTLEQFLLILGNPINSFGSVMVKKQVFKKYLPLKNLDSNNKMFGPLDYFLWLQMFPGKKIYYISKKLLLYRKHQNNFSGDKNVEIMKEHFNLIFYFFTQKNKNNKNILRILKFRQMLVNSISNTIKGNKKLGFKNLFKSFKYYKIRFLYYRLKILIRLLIPKKIIDLILKK